MSGIRRMLTRLRHAKVEETRARVQDEIERYVEELERQARDAHDDARHAREAARVHERRTKALEDDLVRERCARKLVDQALAREHARAEEGPSPQDPPGAH